MRDAGRVGREFGGLTDEQDTGDIPYDFFGKTRLSMTLKTRQIVGRYGVGKSLTGLMATVGFE